MSRLMIPVALLVALPRSQHHLQTPDEGFNRSDDNDYQRQSIYEYEGLLGCEYEPFLHSGRLFGRNLAMDGPAFVGFRNLHSSGEF